MQGRDTATGGSAALCYTTGDRHVLRNRQNFKFEKFENFALEKGTGY